MQSKSKARDARFVSTSVSHFNEGHYVRLSTSCTPKIGVEGDAVTHRACASPLSSRVPAAWIGPRVTVFIEKAPSAAIDDCMRAVFLQKQTLWATCKRHTATKVHA